MLFIHYSAAFNTIMTSKLIKLEALRLNPALYNWVLDFLMGRPQVVKVSNNISTSLTIQHWGSTSVRAQPPPVLPVHPRLRSPCTPPTHSLSL